MCAGVKPTLVEAGAGEVVGEGREERVLERRGGRLDAREKGRETRNGGLDRSRKSEERASDAEKWARANEHIAVHKNAKSHGSLVLLVDAPATIIRQDA